MKKVAKNIYMILCDDIREETGNKNSLIGVYSDSVIVKQTPTILPKISLYVMLKKITRTFNEIKIKSFFPKSNPQNYIMATPSHFDIGTSLSFGLTISPFRITSPGKARFELYVDNEEKPFAIYRFIIEIEKKKDES